MLTYNIPTRELEEKDSLFDEAVTLITETGKASISLIQRRLKLGYARSARLLDQLEQYGLIGTARGDKPREIFISHMVDGEMVEGRTKPPIKEPEIKSEEPKSYWKETKYTASDPQKLEVEIGKDEEDNPAKFDFEKYNNLLIIGSRFTGAVELTNNILSLSLAGYSPDNLRLIAIDGVPGDLTLPNGIPHLLVTLIADFERGISALKWSVNEIERRIMMNENEKQNLPKILLVLNSLNQLVEFSRGEFTDSLYRILVSGRKCGFYCVLSTEYLKSKVSKEIMANIPAKIVFKPTDKKVARDTGISESIDLQSPDEAIIETIFEGRKKLEISNINHKQIYEEIFS